MSSRVGVISIIVESGERVSELNTILHTPANILSAEWEFPIGKGISAL